MAKETKDLENQMPENGMSQQIPATPNRDEYKAAFNEDYPDVDFEDKETRYGKMVEDRKKLKSYREGGKRLNETFSKNRWVAAMIQDLTENDDPEYSPLDWMADNGINISEAMEDESVRKKVSERIAAYQEKQIEEAKEDEIRQKNFKTSVEALKSIGVDDETAMKMWNDLFTNIVDPALRGEVTADTWKMIQKAMNYDTDIENAKQQSAMRARNEKIKNGVKSFDAPMPPTLSQGEPGQNATRKPKNESFFADLKEAGY